MENYLNLNEFPVLKGLGKTSKEQADEKAITEYENIARFKTPITFLTLIENLKNWKSN